MTTGGLLQRLDRFGAGRGGVYLKRRQLADGCLGIVTTGAGGTVVALADDVAAADVAPALLHLAERHTVEAGLTACYPPCRAGERWRPTEAPAVAASLCDKEAG